MAFKTNQLKINLDRDLLNDRFDIFSVSTSDKHFKSGAYIIDAPALCSNVKSVFFENGRRFYVLMDRSDRNKPDLLETLRSSEGGDSIMLERAADDDLPDNVIIQLLLNALGSYNSEILKFNNLTGHLYCFNPGWIKKSKRGDAVVKRSVPCIELKVSEELLINLFVRTLTSELFKNQISFKRKKYEEYPKYVFGANNTIRRRLKGDEETCFILRQIDGERSTIPFLDIQDKEHFDQCKMGILNRTIFLFNEKYAGLCRIDFEEIKDYTKIDCTRKIITESENAVKELLKTNPVRIVDEIGDEYSERFCKETKAFLEELYGADVSIGKRYSRTKINFGLIHNAVYYENIIDPHDKKHEGAVVQHITPEDFGNQSKFAVASAVHEILIKRDIQAGRFSLYDWTKLKLYEEISFGLKAEIDEEERYFFMKIFPDGTFIFAEQELDLFSVKEYSECVNIFTSDEKAVGIIRFADGDINTISDTGWITIPEIEEIDKMLSEGDTHIRGKEKREELLSAVLDICEFSKADEKYYYVGAIGYGMQAKIPCAANIRKITAYGSSKERFEELLPLMNVSFVRNGQLTVLPFPFKYLMEYIRSRR